MIHDLQLKSANALPSITLNGFGKINVVCGKNNSGKSTLLRSIAEPSLRLLGRKLDSNDANEICMGYCQGTIFLQNNSYTPVGTQLCQIINNVALSRDSWFAESNDLASEVGAHYGKNNYLRGYTYNAAKISSLAKNLIAPSQPRAILIPPRRSVEEQSNIQFGAQATSNGLGLINHLFYCHTQAEGTTEKILTQQIVAAFEDISDGFSYRIIPDQSNVINLFFRSPGGTLAPAHQCGQGLQDLLILLYFTISEEYDLLLIEEPESHLHPDMQRKLLSFFSQRPKKQYVIATHSNVFLDSTYVDRVFQTKYSGKIAIEDQTTRAALLSELGYQVTDNLVSDAIILVEGPSDIPVLETFLIKMGAFPQYQIRFWPLGGDIMDKVDLRVFAEGYKIFALIDQDPKSGHIRKSFVAKCEGVGVPICRLKRYSLENYLSVKAIREVFGSQVPDDLESLDPKASVSKQLGFDIKKRSRNISRCMDISDLEGTDLLEFLNLVVSSCKTS